MIMITTLVIWAGAFSSAAIWLWLIRRYDRAHPEPLRVMLRVGLIGGAVSVFLAGLGNVLYQLATATPDQPETIMQAVMLSAFVGINEEFWKAFLCLKLLRREPHFNEPIDGLIYGMTVALGFAAFENIEYAALYGPGILLTRSLMSVPAHICFAAFWGYGLTMARFVNHNQHPLRTMLPYIFMAALAHMAYNLVLFLNSWTVLLVFPLLLALVISTHHRLASLHPDRMRDH